VWLNSDTVSPWGTGNWCRSQNGFYTPQGRSSRVWRSLYLCKSNHAQAECNGVYSFNSKYWEEKIKMFIKKKQIEIESREKNNRHITKGLFPWCFRSMLYLSNIFTVKMTMLLADSYNLSSKQINVTMHLFHSTTMKCALN